MCFSLELFLRGCAKGEISFCDVLLFYMYAHVCAGYDSLRVHRFFSGVEISTRLRMRGIVFNTPSAETFFGDSAKKPQSGPPDKPNL